MNRCHYVNKMYNILKELDSCFKFMLRKIIRNGFKQATDYKYIINDHKLHKICKTTNVSDVIRFQLAKYFAHIIRKPDSAQKNHI